MNNDEFDIFGLLKEIWQQKLLFVSVVVFFALASVFFALSKPNVYRAEVVLAPADNNSSSSSLANRLGGLAMLSGMNIAQADDKVRLALEVLKSRQFISDFLDESDALVPLMAIDKWDEKLNKLYLDPTIYDENNKEWVRKVPEGKSVKPTKQEAYEVFERLLDSETINGFVHITLDFQSPYLAKVWLMKIVDLLNSSLKYQDIKDSKRNIEYLKRQINTTQLADMKSVFYQLIEEQTKKLMLAEAQPEYVFKVIDPAIIPEKKESPKRALICIIGTFLGGVLAFFICIIRVVASGRNGNKALQ